MEHQDRRSPELDHPMSENLTEELHDRSQDPAETVHSCIRKGNLTCLKELLASSPPPDLSYVHRGYGPPLHFAAGCGDLDAVKLLLAAGADPLLVDRRSRRIRPIGRAAMSGHRDVVSHLWTCVAPEELIKAVPYTGTPLRNAAEHGHARIVEDLMSWDGWSKDHLEEALNCAANELYYDVVAQLLKSDLLDNESVRQALFDVVNNDRVMTGGVLEGFDYLNQQRLIELLIDAGADLDNYVSGSGYHLVCKAASNANLTGALKTLLEKGADPNVRPRRTGVTALHILASPVPVGGQNSGREVLNEVAIKLMLRHRASVTLVDKKGDSPIQLAACGSDLHIFCLYLCSFPNRLEDESSLLAFTNENQETLLHYAGAGCCIEIIEYLISRGLDVNAKSAQGWTPLMCALIPTCMPPHKRGTVATMKTTTEATKAALCLISHGADPLIATDEGWTPLHALALHCDLDIRLDKVRELATQLITRGVDPEARAPLLTPLATSDPDRLSMPWGHRVSDDMMDSLARGMIIQPNLTPLHWAAQRGAVGVVKALLAAGVDKSLTDASGVSAIEMARDSKALAMRTEAADFIIDLL